MNDPRFHDHELAQAILHLTAEIEHCRKQRERECQESASHSRPATKQDADEIKELIMEVQERLDAYVAEVGPLLTEIKDAVKIINDRLTELESDTTLGWTDQNEVSLRGIREQITAIQEAASRPDPIVPPVDPEEPVEPMQSRSGSAGQSQGYNQTQGQGRGGVTTTKSQGQGYGQDANSQNQGEGQGHGRQSDSQRQNQGRESDSQRGEGGSESQQQTRSHKSKSE